MLVQEGQHDNQSREVWALLKPHRIYPDPPPIQNIPGLLPLTDQAGPTKNCAPWTQSPRRTPGPGLLSTAYKSSSHPGTITSLPVISDARFMSALRGLMPMSLAHLFTEMIRRTTARKRRRRADAYDQAHHGQEMPKTRRRVDDSAHHSPEVP